MYNKLNEKIEHFTKWTYISLVYFTVAGSMIPSLFVSFIDYYIYDLKDESFQLGFQIMYVEIYLDKNKPNTK